MRIDITITITIYIYICTIYTYLFRRHSIRYYDRIIGNGIRKQLMKGTNLFEIQATLYRWLELLPDWSTAWNTASGLDGAEEEFRIASRPNASVDRNCGQFSVGEILHFRTYKHLLLPFSKLASLGIMRARKPSWLCP